MIAASPITRQTVGRTFLVAISLLGIVAASQLAGVVWAFVLRSHAPPYQAPHVAGATPSEVNGSVSPGGQNANPAATTPDFSANPLTGPEPDAPVENASSHTPVKPVPLPVQPAGTADSEQLARFKELVGQGRQLRDRGDTGTALIRFREAAAMDAQSPEAIYEIALTFEKMHDERAGEQWRRIFDLGESAGPYYTAAEAKINQAKEQSLRQALQQPGAAAPPDAEEGIAPGKTLGLLKVEAQEQDDRNSAKHLSVKIPIKARTGTKVEVRDLTIQVLFYDMVDNQNLVQTTANVSSRWLTAPADWLDSNLETLEVDYQLPLPEPRAARRENRKYFGYLIRIYYKGELQAAAGEPEKLVKQFPPEPKLAAEQK